MKNIAKLIISFSLSFLIFFLAAVFVRYVFWWVDAARVIAAEPRAGDNWIDALWAAIPAAVYFSVLISLAYSARIKMPVPAAVLCVAVMAAVSAAAISLGIERLGALRPVLNPVARLNAESGLLLSGSGNSIILLGENRDARGPRAVAISGRPLIYQAEPVGPNNTVLSLPALPFGGETPWFLRSIGIDFTISAGELKTRFEDNFLFFIAYVFSIAIFLSSLRFLFELSQWPLANIFLGALVFRFILSLEVFLSSREIHTLIRSFLAERVPSACVAPLVFAAAAALVVLYSFLAGIARRVRKHDG